MRFFSSHLDAAALTDSLLGVSSEATTTHLASCADCRAERDRVRHVLDGAAAGAIDAADVALPPARLERQRQSILDRVARVGAGGRLLTFPAAPAPRPAQPASPDRRWIAAAAVAGLLVGVAVGRVWDVSRALEDVAAGPAVESGARAAVDASLEPWRDDPLLSDVDAMLTRDTLPEFEALDELTPISDEGR